MMTGGFWREVDGESAERTPVIHGLLEVIAHLVHISPNRREFNCLNAEDDWEKAKRIFIDSSSQIELSFQYGLKERTLENYFRQEIEYKALEIHRRTGREDPVANWHEAFNLCATSTFDFYGSYLTRQKKAA